MDNIEFYKRFGRCVSIKNSARFPVVLVFFLVILGLSQGLRGQGAIQYWDNSATVGIWHTNSWSDTLLGGNPHFWTDGNSAVFSTDNAAQTGNYSVTLDTSVTVQDFTYRGGSNGGTFTVAEGTGGTRLPCKVR